MKIQIVEDDLSLCEGVAITLNENNEFYKENTRHDAQDGFDNYGKELDMIILDINLPDGSGYDYLKYVRERSDVPVLILTANDLEIDEVTGLTLGADDYLTKPFSLAVLRARVNALIRRSGIAKETEKRRETVYRLDDMIFDFDKILFKKGNEDLFFSVNEQKLLKLFLDNKGRILTREILMERLWGNETD